jgi:hypothetical protein
VELTGIELPIRRSRKQRDTDDPRLGVMIPSAPFRTPQSEAGRAGTERGAELAARIAELDGAIARVARMLSAAEDEHRAPGPAHTV